MFDFVAVFFFSSCSIVNGYLLWLPPTFLVRFTVHFPSVTYSTHQKPRKSNNQCRVVYFVRQFCGGNDRDSYQKKCSTVLQCEKQRIQKVSRCSLAQRTNLKNRKTTTRFSSLRDGGRPCGEPCAVQIAFANG